MGHPVCKLKIEHPECKIKIGHPVCKLKIGHVCKLKWDTLYVK